MSTEAPPASHQDFDQLKTYFVKEYGCYGTLYKHKRTSCEVLSLKADDANKVRVNMTKFM